eukprot:scaffold55346_cov31-Attheya_sp.AAC.1
MSVSLEDRNTGCSLHVTVLGVTTYFPAYVAVSPDCQSDSSDPFWFSSWFFVCFSKKSEISSLVLIPFKMVSAIPAEM